MFATWAVKGITRSGAGLFLAAEYQGCLVYRRTTSVYVVSASDVHADLTDFVSAATPPRKFYSWSEKFVCGIRERKQRRDKIIPE